MKSRSSHLTIFLLIASVVFGSTPVLAYPNPQFDITGVWRNTVNQQLQLFQEKDQVNAIFINQGWAHRMEGRYISPTKIKLVLIRRTRPNTCEMTMTVDITVSSANSFQLTSLATETACGLATGQTFPETYTRVL